MLVIYIICNKAKNTDLKGNDSNKCFFEKTVNIETPPITLKTLSKGLLWKLNTLGGKTGAFQPIFKPVTRRSYKLFLFFLYFFFMTLGFT